MQARAKNTGLVLTAQVETSARRGTKRMSIRPFHQHRNGQKAFCVIDLRCGLTVYAQRVIERIWRIRRDENCGSYVLANGRGEVHVLSEAGLSTAGIIRRNGEDIVGLYAADTRQGRNPVIPPVEQMLGDLRERLIESGFISVADIYAEIRYVAGE